MINCNPDSWTAGCAGKFRALRPLKIARGDAGSIRPAMIGAHCNEIFSGLVDEHIRGGPPQVATGQGPWTPCALLAWRTAAAARDTRHQLNRALSPYRRGVAAWHSGQSDSAKDCQPRRRKRTEHHGPRQSGPIRQGWRRHQFRPAGEASQRPVHACRRRNREPAGISQIFRKVRNSPGLSFQPAAQQTNVQTSKKRSV